MITECKRIAAGAALAAVVAAVAVAGTSVSGTSVRADVLSEMQFLLAGRGVERHSPDRVRRPGLGALDARQPLSPGAGALRADRHRQPALLPVRLRRHRRLRRRLLLHRLRPARGLRPRGRAERRRLRLRAGAGDHLAGDRRDHVEAAGSGAVGERAEPELLRDRPGSGGRGVVEERPRVLGDLRRHRHQPGDIQRLRGGEARLRRRRQAQLDAGGRLRGDGGPGAGPTSTTPGRRCARPPSLAPTPILPSSPCRSRAR